MLETVRNDPEYKDGNYTTQPRSMKTASVFFGIATAGGTLRYQKLAPTKEKADKLVDARLAAPMTADANDFLWQWGSSGDYDASPGLEKIEATVLAINAADDERNPPETGLMASYGYFTICYLTIRDGVVPGGRTCGGENSSKLLLARQSCGRSRRARKRRNASGLSACLPPAMTQR